MVISPTLKWVLTWPTTQKLSLVWEHSESAMIGSLRVFVCPCNSDASEHNVLNRSLPKSISLGCTATATAASIIDFVNIIIMAPWLSRKFRRMFHRFHRLSWMFHHHSLMHRFSNGFPHLQVPTAGLLAVPSQRRGRICAEDGSGKHRLGS